MITHITLYNYRNLAQVSTDISEANIIISGNGTGKSNFLESIYLLAKGKPFRPYSELTELIGPEVDFAKVELLSDAGEFSLVLAHSPRFSRKLQFNGKQKPQTEVSLKVPVILFAPHGVNIASEDPATRRDDLDEFLSLCDRSYAALVSSYNKTLQNRNALLKNLREYQSTPAELDFWDNRLLELGTQIANTRQLFIAHLEPFANEVAMSIYRHQQVNFTTSYTNPSIEVSIYAESFGSKLRANREKEIASGQTLYGPHRDDVEFSLNGRNIRYLGSRGEQRLAVLIWKLGQAEYLYRERDRKPILLIDDLMSELDAQHRELAADWLLSSGYQFIATAADEKDVPVNLISKAARIDLH